MRLSVIIPAYNEELRLPKTLRLIADYLKKQKYDSEILVVEDGSTDKTADVVRSMRKEMPNLRMLQGQHKGKGNAVREGMLAAQGEFRVFMDADNSTTIQHVEKMWPQFEKGYDVVIGSRDIPGAIIPVPQPWLRRRLGDTFNIIVQVISGLWGIWDTQCGFKGFTQRAAEKIFPKASINGWAFDVELLLLAKQLGYTVKEVPVTWINEPHSRVKLRGMVQMFFDVLLIRFRILFHRYGL